MTFGWWTLDEAKWQGGLKCTAGWCDHLPMEVRLRRLRRSHPCRFKQNRSVLFLFLHSYPSGLCSLPKQHANEQTSWTSMRLAHRYGPVYIFLFTVRPPPPKKSSLLVPTSLGKLLEQFCYVLLPGSFVSVETLLHFIPEEFFTPNSFSLTLFAFLMFLFQILSLFNVSFTFRAFVKNPACHQIPSASLTAPVEGQQQKNLSLFSSIKTSLHVCTSWMCVRRSSSWGQSLCVSGTRSITSSII